MNQSKQASRQETKTDEQSPYSYHHYHNRLSIYYAGQAKCSEGGWGEWHA